MHWVNYIQHSDQKSMTDSRTGFHFFLNRYFLILVKYNLKYPRCQRDVIQSHIDNLCESIKRCPNFITHIYIGHLGEEYYVLDGQHRLTSIQKLKINPELKVEIIDLDTEEEINDMFLLINNNF